MSTSTKETSDSPSKSLILLIRWRPLAWLNYLQIPFSILLELNSLENKLKIVAVFLDSTILEILTNGLITWVSLILMRHLSLSSIFVKTSELKGRSSMSTIWDHMSSITWTELEVTLCHFLMALNYPSDNNCTNFLRFELLRR